MNIRVIDPGNTSRPPLPKRQDVFDDLDGGEPKAARDDRFDLLVDLKSISLAYLRRDTGHAELARRADAVEKDIAALRKLAASTGIPLAPAPRMDLAQGFAALAAQAEVSGFDPFASGGDLLTGALVLNSLSLAVIQAFLCEGDASAWRPALLPMLADDARFEGWLDGALAASGTEVAERAAELRALTSGPAACPTACGQRLWSFDLLRMAISRLLCGGLRGHRGGFFPDGMSGSGSAG
ncbi:hypothetical protein OKA05_07535 [Luteolibacter arcticus]|uniref:Uncharacterized protein n=1 Tax=Luteolibacter arcticus TaxID=1581411 RepID=A0ABT3GG12_9BACT|nr:hypothetical protein [Luteolibacter arcticus]MCW1922401.1 hypothetical protein [Luteolibacter arcticus]